MHWGNEGDIISKTSFKFITYRKKISYMLILLKHALDLFCTLVIKLDIDRQIYRQAKNW